ncbi:MAG: hypothetical protein EOO88_08745 [Pedobacter sp.]|nr:MAG: hypothetical protein EOO88_08745 [Pedobacter sp.]
MGFFEDQLKKVEAKATAEVSSFLLENEQMEELFMNSEDYIAFTDKRLVFVDKSLLSSKKAVHSIPYQKIITVSFLKGGAFSIAKEIEIAISGHTYEIKAYDDKKAMTIYKKLLEKLFHHLQ